METSPIGFAQMDTDASKTETKNSTISYICRDNKGRVQHLQGKVLGNSTIPVTETIVIRKAVQTTIQKRLYNIIIESDSQIVIQIHHRQNEGTK